MMLFVNLDGLPCRIEGTASPDFVAVLVASIRDENNSRLERLGRIHDHSLAHFR
jgi:hypothetical protein